MKAVTKELNFFFVTGVIMFALSETNSNLEDVSLGDMTIWSL